MHTYCTFSANTLKHKPSFIDLHSAASLRTDDYAAVIATKHSFKLTNYEEDDVSSFGGSTLMGSETSSNVVDSDDASDVSSSSGSEADISSDDDDDGFEPTLHAGYIPGGRICKRQGHPHRHAVFVVQSIVNANNDTLASRFDAAIVRAHGADALSTLERRADEAEDAFTATSIVQDDRAATLCALEGRGDDTNTLDGAATAAGGRQGPEILHTMHGFPHDMRAPCISRNRLRGGVRAAMRRARSKLGFSCRQAQEID